MLTHNPLLGTPAPAEPARHQSAPAEVPMAEPAPITPATSQSTPAQSTTSAPPVGALGKRKRGPKAQTLQVPSGHGSRELLSDGTVAIPTEEDDDEEVQLISVSGEQNPKPSLNREPTDPHPSTPARPAPPKLPRNNPPTDLARQTLITRTRTSYALILDRAADWTRDKDTDRALRDAARLATIETPAVFIKRNEREWLPVLLEVKSEMEKYFKHAERYLAGLEFSDEYRGYKGTVWGCRKVRAEGMRKGVAEVEVLMQGLRRVVRKGRREGVAVVEEWEE